MCYLVLPKLSGISWKTEGGWIILQRLSSVSSYYDVLVAASSQFEVISQVASSSDQSSCMPEMTGMRFAALQMK